MWRLNDIRVGAKPIQKGERKMIVKLNEILLDMTEVESIEWKENDEHVDNYNVRFHMKSGKMFSRMVHENQLKQLEHYFEGDE